MKFSTIITFLVCWSVALKTFLIFAARENQAIDPVGVAQFWMGVGLFVLFVLIGGWGMYSFRDKVRVVMYRISLPWYVTFILGCLFFAGIEEGIAVLMTNLAPLFGDPTRVATITGETNYFRLIFTKTLFPVFLPMFVAWAWILSRYAFSWQHVFILFGITGWIGEVLFLSGAIKDMLLFGFWILIYGLMIFLPAYSLPKRPHAKTPQKKHFVLALVLPYLAIIPSVRLLDFIKSIDVFF